MPHALASCIFCINIQKMSSGYKQHNCHTRMPYTSSAQLDQPVQPGQPVQFTTCPISSPPTLPSHGTGAT